MHTQTLLTVAALTTMLPLAACALILVLLRRFARLSAAVSLSAAAASLAGAIWLLFVPASAAGPLHLGGTWLVSGRITVMFGYLLDPLSLLMLVIVAAISFLVQLYSLGYMAGDAGFARYYAFLSLFAWAMLNLTLAATLLQVFIFWELVGLSSYLLIGFWFQKYSASQAGKKAFVMTRFGDVAFYLGILLLLVQAGQLDIRQLNSPAMAARLSASQLTWAALLILGGIVGKSAQFPLLTWLPDAMEGPTPVSALLHSATMVAAGVYLLARLHVFFSLSPTALTVCLLVGCLSMLMAASMAMVSSDMKQVWAFSTISQLGFMLMALGAGGFTAGVFHLTTHAAFKALLFLCAGVFIHAFNTNDFFAIGRFGGARLKIPTICTVVGAAALSGLPPFSGFFSKELILAALADQPNPVWLLGGLLGVFLTSYYAFRLVFVILRPARRDEAGEQTREQGAGPRHATGGQAIMALVLIVLSLATLALGWLQGALEGFLASGLEPVPDHPAVWLPYVALGLALAGTALAWLEFGRKGAAGQGFIERWPALADFFARRWYLDQLYHVLLERAVDRGLALICAKGDQRVIDAGLDGLSRATIAGGHRLAGWHAGALQLRLVVLFGVVALLGLYLLIG